LNEQQDYLKSVHELVMLKLAENDDVYLRLPLRSRTRRDLGTMKSDGEQPYNFEEKEKRLLERIRAFGKKLKNQPYEYPIGALIKRYKLNRFEQFVLTVTAALAMFERGRCAEIPVRTLAMLCSNSDKKRIETELYFESESKLEKIGLIKTEMPRWRLFFETVVFITNEGYLAVLGKDTSDSPREERGRDRCGILDPEITGKNIFQAR